MLSCEYFRNTYFEEYLRTVASPLNRAIKEYSLNFLSDLLFGWNILKLRQQPTNFFSVFDHFVRLALKGLHCTKNEYMVMVTCGHICDHDHIFTEQIFTFIPSHLLKKSLMENFIFCVRINVSLKWEIVFETLSNM